MPVIKSGNKIVYRQPETPTPSGWYPPSYWPENWEDEITDSDDGFVALVAVYPNSENYISFRLDYTGGGGTIDWGDGTTQALGASTTTNETMLSYSGVSGAECALGYKIAVVKILISGTLTSTYFSVTHSALGQSVYYSTPYLAIKVRTQNSTILYDHRSFYPAVSLEYLDLGDTPLLPGNSSCFRYHNRLNYINWTPWVGSFNATTLFAGTTYGKYTRLDAFNLDDIDWSNTTSLNQTFHSSLGNQGVFEAEIDNCTSLYYTFGLSGAFKQIILKNTGNVTTIQYCLWYTSTQYFSMDDCSSVSNASNFVPTATANNALTGLILTGLTIGIDVSNCKMDATALDAFFTSLGTASGNQTITVTGNPGAATCDTSIATAKGFTVTT